MFKKALFIFISLALVSCSIFQSSPEKEKEKEVQKKPTKPKAPNLSTRAGKAQYILARPSKFKLANYHLSGVKDQATALKNMQYTSRGQAAKRSAYSTAPGGYCYLQNNMLNGLITLGKRGYSVAISELAGGGHSRTSRHYLGVAYDVTHINGVKVSWSNPYYRDYMRIARQLGATEVLGPGDRGHSGHLHIAWPRTDR